MLGPQFSEALARLPDYLGGHVLVSLTALAIGLAVSLPTAVVSLRRPWLRGGLLAAASVAQTIPGLALLALFYPLLLALSSLSQRLFGVSLPALGFLPAVLALALYAVLPILRNTVTGLAGVPDGVRDAARALGLSQRKSLWLVEMPIALPVVMAGIRTSAVWVIGTATLSTPIGQTSLGNYIFTGLQTQNWVSVVFGCVAAAALALIVDQLLALMQDALATRNRRKTALGAVGLIALVVAALAPGLARPSATYVIGAKTFTEQYVLAALIEQRLAAVDLTSVRRTGLGSNVLFDALAAGDVDVAVDYSGTLWANLMHRTDTPGRDAVLKELGQWLEKTHGVRLLGSLGFENAYALAMTRKKAEALGIRSLADLAARAGSLTIASDYEFFARPEWKAMTEAYGLHFRQQRTMQPDFMYRAAADGEVDVISAYSSDGQLAQYDLITLDDPKQVLPPYDAVLLVSPKRAHDDKLLAAIRPLVGAIDVTTMREANLRGARGDTTPDAVAKWLGEHLRK